MVPQEMFWSKKAVVLYGSGNTIYIRTSNATPQNKCET